ncbi:unnamed protein product [Clonostachys rosea]|uniref:Uncharacterized protein n=1 Tax=Bionectria ochroleuca TaxID=29856 RepID=A0ABY6TXS9_BIOOC|nr:unnamed protein product [Clonostachys rosea]
MFDGDVVPFGFEGTVRSKVRVLENLEANLLWESKKWEWRFFAHWLADSGTSKREEMSVSLSAKSDSAAFELWEVLKRVDKLLSGRKISDVAD